MNKRNYNPLNEGYSGVNISLEGYKGKKFKWMELLALKELHQPLYQKYTMLLLNQIKTILMVKSLTNPRKEQVTLAIYKFKLTIML